MSIGSTQASLFAAFRDGRVEYAVVGGMAVNAHGFIRATRDLDILIGEMTFDRVWRNRVEGTVDGIVVPFISKADLIENKLQVGRTLDIADAEHLMLIPDSESLHLEIEREKQ